jgi:hypothetical protein
LERVNANAIHSKRSIHSGAPFTSLSK